MQAFSKLKSYIFLPFFPSSTHDQNSFNPNCHGLENVQTAMGWGPPSPPPSLNSITSPYE